MDLMADSSHQGAPMFVLDVQDRPSDELVVNRIFLNKQFGSGCES